MKFSHPSFSAFLCGIPKSRALSQSENLLTILSGLIGSVIVMAVATPWFVVVLLVVVYFFVRIQRYYSCAAIQLQRFEAVSRSPLYQHFAETLNGAKTSEGISQFSVRIVKCLLSIRFGMTFNI